MFYKVLLQPEIYQYDVNRKIQVLDKNINEIHFANYRNRRSMAVPVKIEDGKRVCDVPNFMLVDSGLMSIYAYVNNGKAGYTKEQSEIRVIPREIPYNYYFTDHAEMDKLVPDRTFIHTQEEPAEEWLVVHNLNKYPNCSVVDNEGNKIICDIVYIDENSIKLKFSEAFNGKAYFN